MSEQVELEPIIDTLDDINDRLYSIQIGLREIKSAISNENKEALTKEIKHIDENVKIIADNTIRVDRNFKSIADDIQTKGINVARKRNGIYRVVGRATSED